MEYKVCSKCGENKPLTGFHFANGRHKAACRVCINQENQNRAKAKRSGVMINKYSQPYRQEKFISEATKIWGDKYNYTETIVGGHADLVNIFCNKHDCIFSTTQRTHLEAKGAGCAECLKEHLSESLKKTTEEFIADCKSTHGEDRYSYNTTIYTGWQDKIEVFCNTHNTFFEITAGNHQLGQHCPQCSKENFKSLVGKTQEYFESKVTEVHGDRYSFDKAVYKGNKTPVEMICEKHGSFYSTPSSLYRGSGCQKCGDESVGNKLRSSTEEWIQKAIKKHGDKYDYSISQHTGKRNNIDIICKSCNNIFSQRPGNHLNKSGCPLCVVNGYNRDKAGNLYVFVFQNILKIGITNRKVKTRLREINRASGYDFQVAFEQYFENGRHPFEIESILKQYLSDHTRVVDKFDGSTECFTDVCLEKLLDKIKEIQDGCDRPDN